MGNKRGNFIAVWMIDKCCGLADMHPESVQYLWNKEAVKRMWMLGYFVSANELLLSMYTP